MFKRFFNRLKGLYYTPANANENTTQEENTMRELAPNTTLSTDATTADSASTAAATDASTADSASTAAATDASTADSASTAAAAATDSSSPLSDFKAKSLAFIDFVEKGIELLGQEAEADLVALKVKYF